ncbi:MAG: Na+/H+ antiporter NhaA [Streptosporangiales bacterium]|nr:Na+/H+ antiporter NhaA [Streptosporangiales bacterium]
MPLRRAAVFPASLPARYVRHLTEALRTETVGGVVMLAATVVALIWANSPWSRTYEALRTAEVGPASLHLNLEAATWAADGLLAIFFFVAGLEVKEEIAHGELRHPRDAVLPIVAAVGGMVVPALVFVAASVGTPGAAEGWAIPIATDIAFALAVLAVAAPAMPTSLRAFLLTLAVVDDLGAITIIAVFYTDELHLFPLLGAAALLGVYAWLQRRRVRAPWAYVPLALVVWTLVHESGVHATVAGVALGLLTRVVPAPGEDESPAERADHLLRPVSAGFAVPVFALLSAGVTLSTPALAGVFADRVTLGIILGLVVGKFLGVFGGTFLAVRLGFARLGSGLRWGDLAAIAFLTGVGFTVSLLIGELAYGGAARSERATAAILIASLTASLIAAVLLHLRARRRVAGEGAG